jgi:hypothetical protein
MTSVPTFEFPKEINQVLQKGGPLVEISQGRRNSFGGNLYCRITVKGVRKALDLEQLQVERHGTKSPEGQQIKVSLVQTSTETPLRIVVCQNALDRPVVLGRITMDGLKYSITALSGEHIILEPPNYGEAGTERFLLFPREPR